MLIIYFERMGNVGKLVLLGIYENSKRLIGLLLSV